MVLNVNGRNWQITNIVEVVEARELNISASDNSNIVEMAVVVVDWHSVNVHGGNWKSGERAVGSGNGTDNVLNNWAHNTNSMTLRGGVGEAPSQTVRFNDSRVGRWNADCVAGGSTGNSQASNENCNGLHVC